MATAELKLERVLAPEAYRWTADELDRASELGLFEGRRVELIDGEIINMGYQDNLHAVGIGLLQRSLLKLFEDKYWVRIQLPLKISEYDAPVPDAAVVLGDPNDFREHPATALLVVEVSVSSLSYDTLRKASLYASAGVKDYWVVDLNAQALRVFREPVADKKHKFGYRYKSVTEMAANKRLAPLSLPKASIAVADLMPKAG